MRRKRSRQQIRGMLIPMLVYIILCIFLDHLSPATRSVVRQHLALVLLLPLGAAFAGLFAWQLYLQYKS